MKWLCTAKLLCGLLTLAGCASTQRDNGATTTTQVDVPEIFKPRPAFDPDVKEGGQPFEELKEPPDFSGFDVVAIVPPSESTEEKPAETEAED